MLRRTLALALCFGALAITVGASAVSAKDSEQFVTTFFAFPPYWPVDLPGVCTLTLDGSVVNTECHTTAPNPAPPKEKILLKGTCGGTGERVGKLAIYPNGKITVSCRLKLPK